MAAEQEIEFSVEDRSRYVRALYAFEANDNTQLTITPGDILQVFYRDDSGWWDGKNVRDGNDGYFPGNYTEPLGDNLDLIKQQLLYQADGGPPAPDDQADDDDENALQPAHVSRSSVLSLVRDTTDASIDIRNAEPISKRCSKSMRNDCSLCSIHCRALCICIPWCRNSSFLSDNHLDFEYDAYIFRSLSIVQHTLCIFGSVSFNHFISAFIEDLAKWHSHDLDWITSSNGYAKPVFIRCLLTALLSVLYIVFLFLTSSTALQFLKQSPQNQQSTNRRDRNIQRMRYCLCFRNLALKCGQCGIRSCKPYTFIYTQFIMLLCSYILAFMWQDLALEFQANYLQTDHVAQDCYKNVIFIVVLLLAAMLTLYLLKRKLNSVYHIYRYYNKQARDNYNKLQLMKTNTSSRDKTQPPHSHREQAMSPMPKSVHSSHEHSDQFMLDQEENPKLPLNASINLSVHSNTDTKHSHDADHSDAANITRPYQVSLYLYFWCLLTEIALFMFALPVGSSFAALSYWLLSSTQLWDMRVTRLLCMLFYITGFFAVYLISWRLIHVSMHMKKSKHAHKSKRRGQHKQLTKGLMVGSQLTVNTMTGTSSNHLEARPFRINSMSKSLTTTSNDSSLLNHETQSNVTMYSVNTTMHHAHHDDVELDGDRRSTAIHNDEDEMIAEYESDIPDLLILILMKYYGAEIERTEFSVLNTMLVGVFLCDIFVIGCWFNLWLLFDADSDPFNAAEQDDGSSSSVANNEYDEYLDPSTQYLIYVTILTVLLPLICSYLFGKTFKWYCCRRNNYALSIALEKDKLWMKSLLSRWFIVIQSLILGYLWCEYLEVLWLQHIDTKYYTLSAGLSAIVIYFIIAVFIIVFKLNKKLLRLLWTMHAEDDDYSAQLLFMKNSKNGRLRNNRNAHYNYNSLSNQPKSADKHPQRRSRQSGVGNLGLNASVNDFQFEQKKLGRRMISHNTQKAKQATHKLVLVNPSLNASINNSDDAVNMNKELEIVRSANINHHIVTSVDSDQMFHGDDDDEQPEDEQVAALMAEQTESKASGLSTSLLQSDDEDAQIL